MACQVCLYLSKHDYSWDYNMHYTESIDSKYSWNSGLTQHEVRSLEIVQRTAVAVIRGESHTSFRETLEYLKFKTLEERREDICLRFAIKSYKHPKFSFWFIKNTNIGNTRSVRMPLLQIRGRIRSYLKSPLPYFNDLLNTHLLKKDNNINTIRSPSWQNIPLSDQL